MEQTRTMSTAFRHRPAAEVVADPNFERFVAALEQATAPIVPREVLADFFRTREGTLEDVLEEIFSAHPQTISIELILEDAHWVGALEQVKWAAQLELELERVKAELSAVRASLSCWEAFMGGHDSQLAGTTGRVRGAVSGWADRSHGWQRGRSPKRRFEHP
jgi:hypothetical protein